MQKIEKVCIANAKNEIICLANAKNRKNLHCQCKKLKRFAQPIQKIKKKLQDVQNLHFFTCGTNIGCITSSTTPGQVCTYIFGEVSTHIFEGDAYTNWGHTYLHILGRYKPEICTYLQERVCNCLYPLEKIKYLREMPMQIGDIPTYIGWHPQRVL